MSEVMAMLKMAKSAKDVFKLLESGSMASVFFGIEFEAAKEAFARIATAADKKGQTQICIGHLNSCYHSCDYLIRNAGVLDKLLISRNGRLGEAHDKARFLLCVRAICHAYIREEDHCRNDLDLASKYKWEPSTASVIWFLSGGIINPLAAGDVLYSAIRDMGRKQPCPEIDDETMNGFRSILIK